MPTLSVGVRACCPSVKSDGLPPLCSGLAWAPFLIGCVRGAEWRVVAFAVPDLRTDGLADRILVGWGWLDFD